MYDLASALLRPFTLAVLALTVSTILAVRRHLTSARARRWLVVTIMLLWLVSQPIVGHLAIRSLESRFPPQSDGALGDVQAIVVLGGGVRKGPDGTVGLTEDSVMRCLHAAALVKRIGPKPIVLTGGILPSVPSGPPVAEIMQRFLTGLAVPAESLLLDVSATTTYENAVGTRRVLAPMGIQQVALVTDAFHMPRALGVFEAQGLIARPAPLNYRAARFPWGLQMLLPDARAVAQIEAASHEWMGLAWYWLRRRL